MMRLANSTLKKLNAKMQLSSCAHQNFNLNPSDHKSKCFHPQLSSVSFTPFHRGFARVLWGG